MDQATAIEELRERYARGGLPLEEFRQLMGTLMVTTDPAECQAILDRLPAEPAGAVSIPIARREPQRRADGHHITAWFGSVDRSGDLWELGPEAEVSAVFGEVRLDVRMARLAEGENILRVNAIFGEAMVIIPQGLRVYIESQVRFGEVSVPGHSTSGITSQDSFSLGDASTGSYLRIVATATFGEVRITTR
ncbi:MAG TPA: LiaF domain-containing protein [Ktedonobacterales bacterium]|nr:LiaF domain-containing protein [Ktedonobacterales bacterium]